MLNRIYTVGEFIDSLQSIGKPYRSAILFGLEVNADCDDIMTLNWETVRKCRGFLTNEATRIVSQQVRHIRSPYVFWKNNHGRPLPLFDFNRELFDAFDMTWAELKQAYKDMVWTDYRSWKKEFNLT